MKKLYLFIICILSLLLITACNKNTKTQDNFTYRKVIEDETSYNHNGEESSISEPSIVEDEILKAWPKALRNFKGISSDYDTPTESTFGINTKICNMDMPLQIVCPNPSSDEIYYVNYGKDNYIYCLQGDTSTLLVKKEANFLSLWNDELYFMSDLENRENTIDKYTSIYKYNLKSGDIKLVTKTNSNWMNVNAEGIIYTQSEEEEYEGKSYTTAYVYQLDFNGNTSKRYEHLEYLTYKNYKLFNNYSGLSLLNIDTMEEFIIMPQFSEYSSKASIQGDILYFMDKDKLFSLNLNSGEKIIYDTNNYVTPLIPLKPPFMISSYTVLNNEVFVAINNSLVLRGDIVGGPFKVEWEGINCAIIDLYHGGNRLFAVTSKTNDNKTIYELVELAFINDSIVVKELNE